MHACTAPAVQQHGVVLSGSIVHACMLRCALRPCCGMFGIPCCSHAAGRCMHCTITSNAGATYITAGAWCAAMERAHGVMLPGATTTASTMGGHLGPSPTSPHPIPALARARRLLRVATPRRTFTAVVQSRHNGAVQPPMSGNPRDAKMYSSTKLPTAPRLIARTDACDGPACTLRTRCNRLERRCITDMSPRHVQRSRGLVTHAYNDNLLDQPRNGTTPANAWGEHSRALHSQAS